MKRKILLLLIAGITLYGSSCYAQADGKPFSFGFGFEAGPLLGNAGFKNTFSSEVGLSIRFSVKAGPGYATLTPGASLVIPQSVNDEYIKFGGHVPIKLGYKFIFAEKFFVMAEGGYASYTIYTAETSNESDDITKERNGGFTYAPSAGVNLGKFEAALRYEATHLKDSDAKISLLAFRLGFNF